MSNVKFAAIWGRVSTQDQRELSLDSQEVAVRNVLEAQGFTVPAWAVLKVDWSSLDLMACPPFQQLRRWIAEGTVQGVGTLDRDRLQAQGLQRLLFLSECKDKAVPIITVQGPPMLDGGEGQLVELALALGKEKSVLRAQQGARDGLRDRVRLKGLPPNMNSPYGMMWVDNRLIPDENYSVAREIWRLALSGWKLRAIARELTRRGIPTPSGRLGWRPSSIVYILKSRTYSGVIEALKTEAVEPTHRKTGSYGKTSARVRPESDRIRLEGMVDRPIVTEEEFGWVQERLKENQRLAQKNTRLRKYLLRGRIRCGTCGRNYIGVTRNSHSQYYCGGRWQPGPLGDRCPSPRFQAPTLEVAVYAMVQEFLRGPAGFETEMQRRHEITAESAAGIQRELESLEQQQKQEQEAEARAFRLAARGTVSEEVFDQEIGLIRTRHRWIAEQMERLEQQLADIQRYSFTPESIRALRDRLEAKLQGATPEDQRFVLEAVGATVIAHEEGTWELELEVPKEASETVQIVNSAPRFPAGVWGVPRIIYFPLSHAKGEGDQGGEGLGEETGAPRGSGAGVSTKPNSFQIPEGHWCISPAADIRRTPMIHELRIYDTSPGRLPALLDRFPNVIMPFFDKHGMKPVGFWTDEVGVSNRVTYMLAFDDLAHRERAWAAYWVDPERIKAFAYLATDPPFVARAQNTILRPTSFSPLEKLVPGNNGGGTPNIYELRRYDAVPGRRLSALVERFEKVTLDYFKKHGLNVVGFWTDDIGLNVRLTYMLAFDDLAHRDRAWAAFRADPERIQAFAESERNGPLVSRIRNTIMRPTSFSPLQ